MTFSESHEPDVYKRQVLTKYDSNNPPKIELGDTVPGMEIGWVFVDDRLIADDNILLNVSWDILSASGLTMGKDIQIDGDEMCIRDRSQTMRANQLRYTRICAPFPEQF